MKNGDWKLKAVKTLITGVFTVAGMVVSAFVTTKEDEPTVQDVDCEIVSTSAGDDAVTEEVTEG